MNFFGPEAADFCNIQSMNYEFLMRLRGSSSGHEWRQQMAPILRPVIGGLSDLQVERLSATPFLLFSLREREQDYWSLLASDDPNGDLLIATDQGHESGQLAAACLGFLWQLARRNPYAVRLVSGATLNWCEQLAECTLFRLLQRMAGRSDLLRARRAGDVEFWNKLLGPGLSSERDVRKAAQLSALQSILTPGPAARYRSLRAAACSAPAPSLQITDKRDPS